MKISITKLFVVGATAALALAPGAASASTTSVHCPHGITPDEVVRCGCEISMNFLSDTIGGDWQCSAPPDPGPDQ